MLYDVSRSFINLASIVTNCDRYRNLGQCHKSLSSVYQFLLHSRLECKMTQINNLKKSKEKKNQLAMHISKSIDPSISYHLTPIKWKIIYKSRHNITFHGTAGGYPTVFARVKVDRVNMFCSQRLKPAHSIYIITE